jgi:hypothetical protein
MRGCLLVSILLKRMVFRRRRMSKGLTSESDDVDIARGRRRARKDSFLLIFSILHLFKYTPFPSIWAMLCPLIESPSQRRMEHHDRIEGPWVPIGDEEYSS